MVRFLQTITVIAIISSIFVLVRCISQMLKDAPEVKYSSEPSIRERVLQIVEHSEKSNQVTTQPLVINSLQSNQLCAYKRTYKQNPKIG